MPEVLLTNESGTSALDNGDCPNKSLNLLAYVHLRNIHASTGAGRVARQLTECLAKRGDVSLRVLADPGDHARIASLVGFPWDSFTYHFLESETSRQQAKWFFFDGPKAEHYWQEADVVHCTAESFIPTRTARLAVTLHDAAYLEPDAHQRDGAFHKQRLKWLFLYRKLLRRADLFHTVSRFSAERFHSISSRRCRAD